MGSCDGQTIAQGIIGDDFQQPHALNAQCSEDHHCRDAITDIIIPGRMCRGTGDGDDPEFASIASEAADERGIQVTVDGSLLSSQGSLGTETNAEVQTNKFEDELRDPGVDNGDPDMYKDP